MEKNKLVWFGAKRPENLRLILRCFPDMARFLLSLGANPDVQNKRGCTAVMIAAELGNYAIVSLLSRNNANLQIQDNEGKGKQMLES